MTDYLIVRIDKLKAIIANKNFIASIQNLLIYLLFYEFLFSFNIVTAFVERNLKITKVKSLRKKVVT